ncbi:MAG TPA: ATP-binding protein [Burkholderiales bacterium]|jgi:signal transduction histidine kinase|nr:ATP-binding protein [Burkholderiales bacterium]
MRILRIALYAAMALVLAGGWAFLYWQSSDVDLQSASDARAALNELRSLDARWNDQLMNLRLGSPAGSPAPQPRPAGPLVPQPHGKAYSDLERQALRLAVPPRALAGVKEAFDEKAALMEKVAAGDGALVEKAWYVPTGPRLDGLARGLDLTFDVALSYSDIYRSWLLYYSGFLLTVLAYAMWQLWQAKAGLERRVAERTRELSDALVKLKESEAMLIQSEKMSSLGQMVAGIAHEVNTPLAYVKASLESVRAHVPEMETLARETEQLLAALAAENPDEQQLAAQFETVRARIDALRARGSADELTKLVSDGVYGIEQISAIVANLKDFSRLDRSKVAQYDVHEGIESTLRIAHNQIKHRAVRKHFGALPKISCSPSQINQVLLNLLSNAAQATSETEGAIDITTRMAGDKQVAIEVADNGHGIPAEVMPRLFEPFFTTKAPGKGTGLGLAISYKIVQNHGGRLEAQSTPGAGTRFTMTLPVSA